MNDGLINEKLRELRRLKRAAEELQQSVSALEDEIKAEMTSRDVAELVTADYKVTWKTVSSIRLDTKALKEERPEIYARYAKESESRRFVVS